MSKDYLKALETFFYVLGLCVHDDGTCTINLHLNVEEGKKFAEELKKAYKVIDESLHRLEDIDNSSPNEVMNELNEIIEYITEDKKVKYKSTILFDCDIIKDYLLKAQENEKVLEIVNEIITTTEDRLQDIILRCKDYEEYIGLWYWERELTEEEFNAIKRYFKNGPN